MLKGILIALLVLLGLAAAYLLFLSLSALFVNSKREYDAPSRYYRFVYNSIVFLVTTFTGVRLHVTGQEKLPEGAFFLVGNHRSGCDPLITLRAFSQRPMAFVSKPENFKIPVIRRLMWRCCCMPIDRESPRRALPTIQRCIRLLQSGTTSLGIYPEGTRSRGGELLPFHNSVFKVAQRGGVPMAVVGISGSESVMKNAPWRRTDVYLDVLAVIPYEQLQHMSTQELSESTRALLEEGLRQRANQ